jgi:hypothetical protein
MDGVAKCVALYVWVAQSCLGVACGRERGEIVSKARGRDSSPIPVAEQALQELQQLVRKPPPTGERPVSTVRLPADLASSEARALGFLRDEMDAADKVTAVLLGDLRFEHLDRAEDKVQRFMAECWADRSTDHVALFVASHAAEVRKATCYIPVEFLSVTSVTEFSGVRLLPVDDPQVPPPTPWFVLEKPTGCVAAVEVEGSSFVRMADRARERVNHLLCAVRIAQSGHVHGFQLRFRIGIGYAFDGLRQRQRKEPQLGRQLLSAGGVALPGPGGQERQRHSLSEHIHRHPSAQGRHLPSGYPQVNLAWMWGALLAAAMAAWLHQLTAVTAGEDILAGHGVRGGKAMIATLRWRLIAVPGRLIRHARHLVLRLPPGHGLLPEVLARLRELPVPA